MVQNRINFKLNYLIMLYFIFYRISESLLFILNLKKKCNFKNVFFLPKLLINTLKINCFGKFNL